MKQQPTSYKKSNTKRKAYVCRRGTAAQSIGLIEKNQDIFCLTYGQFSLIDALVTIIDQTGPAHVILSTWTAGHAHLEKSAEMLKTSEILSMKMIVDRSFKTRQPEYYNAMLQQFGCESIRSINTHAKFIVVRNDKFDIVIRTSMNLNNNPRLENIEISESKDFADFFQQIADDVFEEVEIGELKSDQLSLGSFDEKGSFKPITAQPIMRSKTNEPKVSHEIRNKKTVQIVNA